jgi:prepilin-type N-terminal cleavage/methylation domain-containing protein
MTTTNTCYISSRSSRSRLRAGFSLTELLVVIVIIVTLAALSFVGVNRGRLAAAKANTASQMRQVGIAVTLWAGEKNNGEPFYSANGTGTYSHERIPGAIPLLAPGNPAMALFNKDDPSSGYMTDYTQFFSPLIKRAAPNLKSYDPAKADATNPWGTYAWFHPMVPLSQRTERQKNAMMNSNISTVGSAAMGRLLMATDYTNSPPKWGEIYFALMIDGSVREVAQNKTGWDKWAWAR